MKKWVRALCTLLVACVIVVILPLGTLVTVSYASEDAVDKTGLERVIRSAEKILPDAYSESSYEVLEQALTDAQDVLDDSDATQEEVNEAMLQVSDAIAGLREKLPLILIIALVVAVAFVVGSGIVFVVVRAKERRQNEFECRMNEQNTWQAQMTSVEGNRVRRNSVKAEESGIKTQPEVEVNTAEAEAPAYVCEATTILSQELGATAVLYQPQPKYEPKAYIIRLRTGERIDITKPEFTLGKDYTVSDYCLEGNSAISRAHAAIIDKGNEFELADKKATNGTYVNGLRVMEPWNVVLLDCDIVKLADEEFEFHYIKS